MENNQELIDLDLYPNPNPNTGIFEFEDQLFVTPYSVTVYNGLGSQLLSLTNKNKIDISHFPDGNYFLLIKNEEKYSIKKLILQR